MFAGVRRALLAIGMVGLTHGSNRAVAAGTPPAGTSPPALAAATVQFQLGNGLRVILAPEPWSEQVAVSVAYPVGYADDPKGYQGLAHFAEHLSFRASRHLRDLQAARLLASTGAAYNAVTSAEDTVFSTEAAADQLETLLWLESERMAFAVDGVTDEIVQSERRVVLAEMAERSTARDLYWPVARGLYGRAHPFSPSDEPAADLDAITAEGLRRFMQGAYRPDHATLAVVGRFDVAPARAAIERFFGSIRNAPVPRGGGVVAPPPRLCGVHRLLFDQLYSLGRPTFITWSLPPPRSAVDMLTLAALATALEARLTVAKIDRKVLVRDVNAQLLLYRSHALLQVEANLFSDDDARRVEDTVGQEVQNLAETPIAEDDLRAMKGALFIALIAATESPTERADALAVTGGLRDPVRMWAAARALTAVDLQRAARSLSRGRSVVQMRPGVTSRQAAVMVSEEGECR